MKLRFNRTQGLILALIIHVLVIGLLVLSSFDSEKSVKPEPAEAEPKIMNAVVIDQSKIKAEAKRLEEAEKKRKAEEKKLADLKQQQKELKQKRQQEEEAHKKAEQKRIQQEKLLLEEEQKQQAEEQAKLEAEQLQKEQEQKKLEEEQLKKEAEAEKQRLEEETRQQAELEKKRLEEEARQKAEADKKAKAEAEAKQRADDEHKLREAEMAAEEAARAKEIADGFYGKIAAQVERRFNIRGFKPGLKCVLEIRMIPSGDVTSVKVIKSSGDARFDRAAEIAAKKASPLPVPSDKKIFNQYLRTVRFEFEPG